MKADIVVHRADNSAKAVTFDGIELDRLGGGCHKTVWLAPCNKMVVKAANNPRHIKRDVAALEAAHEAGVPVALPYDVDKKVGFFTQEVLTPLNLVRPNTHYDLDESISLWNAAIAAVAKENYNFYDMKLANLGVTPGGQILAHDLEMDEAFKSIPTSLYREQCYVECCFYHNGERRRLYDEFEILRELFPGYGRRYSDDY